MVVGRGLAPESLDGGEEHILALARVVEGADGGLLKDVGALRGEVAQLSSQWFSGSNSWHWAAVLSGTWPIQARKGTFATASFQALALGKV